MNKYNQPLTLYHGSRGGLDGNISCKYLRTKCDFGKGFYTTDSIEYASNRVMHDANPYLCKLKFDIQMIDSNRIIELTLVDWVLFIAYNLGYLDVEKNNFHYEKMKQINENYDVIIGLKTEGRCRDYIKMFLENKITDSTLFKCMQVFPLVKQYVLKTETACNHIYCLSESKITDDYYYRELSSDEVFSYENEIIELENIINNNKDNNFGGYYINDLINKETDENELIIRNMYSINEDEDYSFTL